MCVCVGERERERVQRIAEAAAAAVNRLPRCAHSALLLLLLCGFFFVFFLLLSVHYVAEFNQSRSKAKEREGGVGGCTLGHLVVKLASFAAVLGCV